MPSGISDEDDYDEMPQRNDENDTENSMQNDVYEIRADEDPFQKKAILEHTDTAEGKTATSEEDELVSSGLMTFIVNGWFLSIFSIILILISVKRKAF